jgi:2-polyprenyl-6-methoxyphenol hydroxylase-like FAD-dependent oxidoreductase
MPTALVVGGSIGGLFAANILARAGWAVTVAERAAGPLSGRGAGIVTHPALVRALARAGVPSDAPLGVAVPGRRVLSRGGGIAAERPLPQVLTSWSRLHALLEAAFGEARIRRASAAVALAQDEAGVEIGFADGSRAQADLVVAADGIRSTLRGLLLPGVQPQYAGYVAWRGLAEEAALSPAAHAALFGHFAFSLPEGEQMLGYPVAGADDDVTPGRRRYNFVWYRPADAATELSRMQTDTESRVHADGIPPQRIRPELVAGMRADADRLLAPAFAEVVRAAPQPFFQPIMDLDVPSMAQGRIAILGDAAFVARPHCGMGVTKAAEDAEALADALATEADIPAALRAWDALRAPAGRHIVHHARRLGAYMQARRATPEERAMAEAYRTPEAVMRETAVPPGT